MLNLIDPLPLDDSIYFYVFPLRSLVFMPLVKQPMQAVSGTPSIKSKKTFIQGTKAVVPPKFAVKASRVITSPTHKFIADSKSGISEEFPVCPLSLGTDFLYRCLFLTVLLSLSIPQNFIP
jgi:hypothetical protein